MLCQKTPDMKALFKGTTEEIDVTQNDENKIIHIIIMDIPKTFIKKGVILTNTERNWESANEFFRSNLHLYYILIMRLM